MSRDAIFISYRRADSAGHAGRLYDHLSAHFGAERVFMDVDAIQPGEDFVKALETAEQRSAALVVVIGKSWLTPRLSDPQDFVRLEIASAINAKLRLFPVLVQGAGMPQVSELPPEIASLAHFQALVIRDDGFQRDAADLAAALSQVVESPEPSPTFAGSWEATVKYGWGVTHNERFEFEIDDEELLGTATYGQSPRAIEEGKVVGNKISFSTKSLTVLGDKTYQEKHSYFGKLVDGQIKFRLQTETGYDSRLPESFTATRRLR